MQDTEATAARHYFLQNKERSAKKVSKNLREMLISNEDEEVALDCAMPAHVLQNQLQSHYHKL